MIRTVAVFVFVSFACVATAFSQTIEKEIPRPLSDDDAIFSIVF